MIAAVICRFCGKLKKTAQENFRCCGIQQNTRKNAGFYQNEYKISQIVKKESQVTDKTLKKQKMKTDLENDEKSTIFESKEGKNAPKTQKMRVEND